MVGVNHEGCENIPHCSCDDSDSRPVFGGGDLLTEGGQAEFRAAVAVMKPGEVFSYKQRSRTQSLQESPSRRSVRTISITQINDHAFADNPRQAGTILLRRRMQSRPRLG